MQLRGERDVSKSMEYRIHVAGNFRGVLIFAISVTALTVTTVSLNR